MRTIAEDDIVLLQRVGQGDTGAFDVLYRKYAPVVSRYAWGLTGSREETQEVLQDTFLTLWRRASDVDLQSETLLPWLLVVCRHVSSNYRRATTRAQRVVSAVTQRAAVAHGPSDPSDMRWILDAIENLPPRDRSICFLCLVDGMTYRQVGAQLNLSESAVAKRVERIRIKLKKELQHDE